jgi:hypothetical protein
VLIISIKFMFYHSIQQPLYCSNLQKPRQIIKSSFNGATHYENIKQKLEHQNFHLLRGIWWSKFLSIFKCSLFVQHYIKIDICGHLKTLIFLHRCLMSAVLLDVHILPPPSQHKSQKPVFENEAA